MFLSESPLHSCSDQGSTQGSSDHAALMEILADLYSVGPRAFESILLPCARMMKHEQAELELSGCFSLGGCRQQ